MPGRSPDLFLALPPRRRRRPLARLERAGGQLPDPARDRIAVLADQNHAIARRLRDQHDRSAMAHDVHRRRAAAAERHRVALDAEDAPGERHASPAQARNRSARAHRVTRAQRVEARLKIGGQRRLERHRPAGRRMRERQSRGVQERTIDAGERRQRRRQLPRRAAVHRIADDGVARLAEVHANLMRAAGADASRARAKRRRCGSTLTMRDVAGLARRDRLDMRRRCRVSRPIAASSTCPARGVPHTSATYSLPTSRSWNCRASSRCARSCLATTITPDVPRSRRCTMPGRASPPMPLSPLT